MELQFRVIITIEPASESEPGAEQNQDWFDVKPGGEIISGTVDLSTNGSLAIGNSAIQGGLGAINIAVQNLGGGTLSAPANLYMSTNTVFVGGPGNLTTIFALTGSGSTSNLYVNSSTLNISNTTVLTGNVNYSNSINVNNYVSVGGPIVTNQSNLAASSIFGSNAMNQSPLLAYANNVPALTTLSNSGAGLKSVSNTGTGLQAVSNTGNPLIAANGTTTFFETYANGSSYVYSALLFNGIYVTTLNSNGIYVGNSLVNTSVNSSTTQVGANVSLNTLGLSVNNGASVFFGNSVVTGVGANLAISNTTALTVNNISVGNSMVNSSINATSFSGTSYNSLNFGGQPPSYYAPNQNPVFPMNLSVGTGVVGGAANCFNANTSAIFIGNSVVNATMNSTSYTGSANNASNFNGLAPSAYQLISGLQANIAPMTVNSANFIGTLPSSNVANNTAPVITTTLTVGTTSVINTTCVSVSGNVTGSQHIGSQLILTGNATIGGNASITGNTSIGGNVAIMGSETITGNAFISGSVYANAGLVVNNYVTGLSGVQFAIQQGTYGVIHRLDAQNYYILTTANNNPTGTWNSNRPFTFNLYTGAVTIDGTGTGTTFGGSLTTGSYNTNYNIITATSNNTASFVGYSNSGMGVYGFSNSGIAIAGISNTNFGVEGSSTSGAGVVGTSVSSYGVYGQSNSQPGVIGISNTSYGVLAQSTSTYGAYIQSGTGPVAYFGNNATQFVKIGADGGLVVYFNATINGTTTANNLIANTTTANTVTINSLGANNITANGVSANTVSLITSITTPLVSAGTISTTGNITVGGYVQAPLLDINYIVPNSYTLLASDLGKTIFVNSSSPTTITVPQLTVTGRLMITRQGSGSVTLVGSGITLNSRTGNFGIINQYGSVSVMFGITGYAIVDGNI